VSAQFVLLGKLACAPSEWAVDPNKYQLTLQRLELLARPTVPRGAQPTATVGGSERRTTLGIAQDAGCRSKPRAPQLGHQFRAGLDDDELDERRGVEVQDQRRCSATRSETEPRAFTRAWRELRARAGGGDETSPDQIRKRIRTIDGREPSDRLAATRDHDIGAPLDALKVLGSP